MVSSPAVVFRLTSTGHLTRPAGCSKSVKCFLSFLVVRAVCLTRTASVFLSIPRLSWLTDESKWNKTLKCWVILSANKTLISFMLCVFLFNQRSTWNSGTRPTGLKKHGHEPRGLNEESWYSPFKPLTLSNPWSLVRSWGNRLMWENVD